jgi:hypothetical protein
VGASSACSNASESGGESIYSTKDAAWADAFDNIKMFYNPKRSTIQTAIRRPHRLSGRATRGPKLSTKNYTIPDIFMDVDKDVNESSCLRLAGRMPETFGRLNFVAFTIFMHSNASLSFKVHDTL